MNTSRHSPAWQGGLYALLAAALFGVSTPLVQRLSVGLGPFTTAALLYGGAAMLGALWLRPAGHEARLQPADGPRLALMSAFGAVLGPAALAWGLQQTSGTSASLMLTLEAVFTAVLARLFYNESLDRRVISAMALLMLGGGCLLLDQGRTGTASALGLLAVAVATLAWGMDNTLSRALAERDPAQVVLAKSALGALASAGLAGLGGEPAPGPAAMLGLLLIGATGYGLSLRVYLLAQRAFGAARTGSVFAFAPFIGALVALMLGDRAWGPLMSGASVLMLAGVILHLAERHEHEHTHEALLHEHAHRHDDGHHTHTHDPLPAGPHSHVHRHEPVTHGHAHVPDVHHAHPH